MKNPRFFLPLIGSGLLLAAACGGGDELAGSSIGPPGTGGFDPGHNPSVGAGASYGGGANGPTSSSSSGVGGSIDPDHPVCDDTQKRCDHVFTYADMGETTVELRGDFAADGWTTGVPMTKSGGMWSVTLKVPWNGVIHYKLLLNGSNWIADPANPNQEADGFGGFNSILTDGTCDKWTCEPGNIGTFDWRDAVLYFVFVDRFVDGNPSNNGAPTPGVEAPAVYKGGDWTGVTQKINSGYFNDLGVNVLWLSVPVDNTEDAGAGTDGHQYSAYHSYWPKNLDKPEEHFGTLPELKALVDAAHAKKLKVILDYAMNHVHISSPVYAQHNDWFWPIDFQGGQCVCGSAVCGWDAQPKRCWFTSYLPDFNFTVDAARKYSVDNAVQWVTDTGVDGFRLDAVKHIEDSWLLDLRTRVKSDIESKTGEHFYMVGETYTGDQGLIKYYVNPSMLDGQFDFPLRAKLIRSVLMRDPGTPMTDLDGFLTANEDLYGAGIMSTFIGNHDVPRSIHFAQDQPVWTDEWADGKDKAWNGTPSLPAGTTAFERLANAFTVLYTTKGVPLVYYGDEVAMPGGGDPDNRRMMQWSGYSAGQSLVLAHLKKLGAIRAAHEALRRGARTSLGAGADTLAWKMATAKDTVYIAVNRSDSSQSVGGLPGGALKDELGGGMVNGPSVTVPARSALILVAP